ncbi:hypothetical protein GQH18_002223 [Salmonella enterica]|nr:hypothetical protein [Salmonella enterica]
MFDVIQVAKAVHIAALSSYLTQVFPSVIGGDINPEAVEVPVIDFTITQDEQTGIFSISSPLMSIAYPFTLDNGQDLINSVDNALKITGAGIAISAAYRLANADRPTTAQEWNEQAAIEAEQGAFNLPLTAEQADKLEAVGWIVANGDGELNYLTETGAAAIAAL